MIVHVLRNEYPWCWKGHAKKKIAILDRSRALVASLCASPVPPPANTYILVEIVKVILAVGYLFQDFRLNDFTGSILVRHLYGRSALLRPGQYVQVVGPSTGEPETGCHPEHAIVSGLRPLCVRTTSAEIEGDPSKAEQPCCAEVVRRWVDAMLWPSPKFQK